MAAAPGAAAVVAVQHVGDSGMQRASPPLPSWFVQPFGGVGGREPDRILSAVLPGIGGTVVGRVTSVDREPAVPQASRSVVVPSEEPPHGPPRIAFVPPTQDRDDRDRLSEDSAEQQRRLSKISYLFVCMLEAAIIIPTIQLEAALAEASWSVVLRLMIAAVRFSPLISPCMPYIVRCIVRCSCMLPRSVTRWYHSHMEAIRILASFIIFPEVRWCLAVTLDMWYLLSTPLNKSFTGILQVVILVANIVLCFVDTLMLIIMLAVKTGDTYEEMLDTTHFAAEVEARGARPHLVKLGEFASDESGGKCDPTCIICLMEFEQEDELVQLPCNHVFHTDCIGKWLSRSRHCPLRCPQVVLPPIIWQTHVEDLLLPSQTHVQVLDEFPVDS